MHIQYAIGFRRQRSNVSMALAWAEIASSRRSFLVVVVSSSRGSFLVVVVGDSRLVVGVAQLIFSRRIIIRIRRRLSGIPNESQLVKSANALFGDVTRLPKLELPVLSALVVHPRRELGIIVIGRHDAAPVFFIEVRKLAQTLKPSRFMSIIAEFKAIEFFASLCCHVGRLSLFH